MTVSTVTVYVSGVTSNITVVKKKTAEPYINWNYSEGRPLCT